MKNVIQIGCLCAIFMLSCIDTHKNEKLMLLSVQKVWVRPENDVVYGIDAQSKTDSSLYAAIAHKSLGVQVGDFVWIEFSKDSLTAMVIEKKKQ